MKKVLLTCLLSSLVVFPTVASAEVRTYLGHSLQVEYPVGSMFIWRDPVTKHKWVGLVKKRAIYLMRRKNLQENNVFVYMVAPKGEALNGGYESYVNEFSVDCSKGTMKNVFARASRKYFEAGRFFDQWQSSVDWITFTPSKKVITPSSNTIMGMARDHACTIPKKDSILGSDSSSIVSQSETLYKSICKKHSKSSKDKFYELDGERFRSCGGGVLTNGAWTGMYIPDNNQVFLVKEPGVVDGRAVVMLSALGDSYVVPAGKLKSSVVNTLVDCRAGKYKYLDVSLYEKAMGRGKKKLTESGEYEWVNDKKLVKELFCANH